MAWITVEDVTYVFPDAAPSDGQIDHVQGLAEAVIGEQEEPVGKSLKAVMVEIVHRFWRASKAAAASPEGYERERIDDYEYQHPAGGPLLSGFGLTKKDEKDLRRAVGKSAFWVQPTTRGDGLETAGPGTRGQHPNPPSGAFVEVGGGGDPILYLADRDVE